MTTCTSEQLAGDRQLRVGVTSQRGRDASISFMLLLIDLEGKCVKVSYLLLKLLLNAGTLAAASVSVPFAHFKQPC